MNEREIEAFKNRIKNYAFLKEETEELKELVELKWYDLAGVKGISFDRTAGTTNQLSKDLAKLEGFDEIEKLEKRIKEDADEIDKIDSMLNQLDEYDRQLIKKKFIHNYTFTEISKMSYSSRSSIKRSIDKALAIVRYI